MKITTKLSKVSAAVLVFPLGLALLVILTPMTPGRETQEPAQPFGDSSEFRTLYNPAISADGSWMAAEEHPGKAGGNVRVWSTQQDLNFTIERGQNPRISRDSRWVSALQKPPLGESRTVRPKGKRGGQTLVLLDTQDGSRRTFDFVLSHDWIHTSRASASHLIYLQSPEPKVDGEGPSKDRGTKPVAMPSAKAREMGTLHVVHLESDNVLLTMENVAHYATHQTEAMVAWVVPDEETGGDSLRIVGIGARNWGTNGLYNGEKIEGLRWARDRITLGFLHSTITRGKDGKRRVNSALYTWQRGQSWNEKFTRVNPPR